MVFRVKNRCLGTARIFHGPHKTAGFKIQHLIWLGPMIPLNGRQVAEVLNLCRPLYDKYGFEFSTALMIANPRCVIALMSIFFDKEDPEETARAQALYMASAWDDQALAMLSMRSTSAGVNSKS